MVRLRGPSASAFHSSWREVNQVAKAKKKSGDKAKDKADMRKVMKGGKKGKKC